ncbi:MAG TPA: hypothetical protein VI653_14600 [Steroidobacteraceae bacterium]
MLTRHSRVLLAFAVLTAGAGIVLADDTRKPVDPATDDELLEFLGSVDPASDTVQPDDGTWIEYLSQTDIGKVAAKPGNPTVIAATPPTPPAPPPKPSAPGAKQNE